jgi:nickel-dependent lactate racemase
MSTYYAAGSESAQFTADDLRRALAEAFGKLGSRKRVLALPPDFTRFHSQAGLLTRLAHEYFGERLTDVLPALGTHSPMSEPQIQAMFGDLPRSLFRAHDWRSGLVTLGEVPAEYVHEESEGKLNFSWPAQVDQLLVNGGHDLILSIGQVVPHEVIGMAN